MILPWGVLNVITDIFGWNFDIFIASIFLMILELILIIYKKYPSKLKSDLNAVIFYLLINVISNIISFMWLIREFEM